MELQARKNYKFPHKILFQVFSTLDNSLPPLPPVRCMVKVNWKTEEYFVRGTFCSDDQVPTFPLSLKGAWCKKKNRKGLYKHIYFFWRPPIVIGLSPRIYLNLPPLFADSLILPSSRWPLCPFVFLSPSFCCKYPRGDGVWPELPPPLSWVAAEPVWPEPTYWGAVAEVYGMRPDIFFSGSGGGGVRSGMTLNKRESRLEAGGGVCGREAFEAMVSFFSRRGAGVCLNRGEGGGEPRASGRSNTHIIRTTTQRVNTLLVCLLSPCIYLCIWYIHVCVCMYFFTHLTHSHVYIHISQNV